MDQFGDKSNHEDCCKDDNSNYKALFMNIILKMAMEKRKWIIDDFHNLSFDDNLNDLSNT